MIYCKIKFNWITRQELYTECYNSAICDDMKGPTCYWHFSCDKQYWV